jgi:mannose-6-phosphate isomerase-like protein (cupin superfamily)
MTNRRPAAIFATDTERVVELGASTVRILLGAEQTNGRVAVLDYVGSPGFAGPPLHTHPAYDEVFYVLEGTARFRLGDETLVAGPGEGVFVDGSTPHTFANPGDEELRYLCVVTPGGMERYFEEVAPLMAGGAPDAGEVAALWQRYGMEPAAADGIRAWRPTPREVTA